MILVIGEILIDELPEGRRPGGAPFNVAQHLARLGTESFLLSRVGCDETGDHLLATMRQLGLRTGLVQRDPEHETGRVQVKVSGHGIPSYTMIDNVAYDYIDFQSLEMDLASCPMVCFGSLIQRTEFGFRQLQAFLSRLPPHVLRLYDMNLRPDCDQADVVFQSLEKTDVLKVNDEELEHTSRLLGSPLKGDALVHHLMQHFNIQTVALTLGEAGSVLYVADNKYEVPATPLNPDEIADTVGAGDSFTAVLVHGIIHGIAPNELLERANRLAGRMCMVHGAVPAEDSIYNDIK
ncbi:carbohydrate kinase [Pontiellaceae bacterium B1224]|nr:carbohydrate kinase [Pontiellaceae bacterium B1224]